MRFAAPFAFFLILFAGLLFLPRKKQGAGLLFSATITAAACDNSPRQRLALLPRLLRATALVLLAIAIARPQLGLEKIRDIRQGIAIEMVLDRSGSMREILAGDGPRMNRLQAAKKIFSEFVRGNGRDLPGRDSDLVGMVAFARYPETVCPLTLAHEPLHSLLDTIHPPRRRSEDGTAIGDAITLAAARLKTAAATGSDRQEPRRAGRKNSYQIKSRIIILLTDGENNAGDQTPEEAAALAAQWGIRIYAIGIGGDRTIPGPLGIGSLRIGSGIDTETLKKVAAITGGRFWLAKDTGALRDIYREIDQLEKSEVTTERYLNYRELFTPFALGSLFLLLLETLLTQTVFRRIP